MQQILAFGIFIFYGCLRVTAKSVLTNYGSCQTPDHENGLCIHLTDCPDLYAIVLSSNVTESQQEYLQATQCGYDNSQSTVENRALVCCNKKFLSIDFNANTEPADRLPIPGECGKVLDNKIIGGNVTGLAEFPWMVLLEFKKPNKTSGFYCGGSLINSHYVLTAAHCINNTEWEVFSVRLGEWDLREDPDCIVNLMGRRECADPVIDIPIESVVVHESYSQASLDKLNDIALIRLTKPVNYSRFIKPICLPLAEELRSNNLFEMVELDVAGWGVTETDEQSSLKLKIKVNTTSIEFCGQKYKAYQRKLFETKQICAGGEEAIDTCRGDSGGPLMARARINKQDICFLAGIVSYGPKPCGTRNWPGVYTRVDHFIDWIQTNLKP